VLLQGTNPASEKKGTLPETNIVPENGWWEDDISFWGPAYFHQAMFVSGSVRESGR